MIETIIAALVSAAATEAGPEICRRTANGLRAVLRTRSAGTSVVVAADKLERGEVDQPALRHALELLTERDLMTLKAGVDGFRGQSVASSAHLDLRGAIVSGSSTVTGVSNTIKN